MKAKFRAILMFGVLLSDLSNAFDCLSHEPVRAKLSAYGVDISTIRLIYDYLTNSKQRSLRDLIFGVL